MVVKRPVSISLALLFILIDAFIWLAFGIIVALGLHPALPENRLIQWTIATLALGSSTLLAAFGFFLARRKKVAYYLVIALLALISVLAITDDFGLSDLGILLLTVAPLPPLFIGRRWFLKQ